MTLYHITNLQKSYNGRSVLDIDHLEIDSGKIYGLLGPNGAGKTTLLNILGFLDSPSAGRLDFNGQRVRFHEADLRALRQKVVVLDQYPVLFTTSVHANLEFGLKIRNIAKKKREYLIDEALNMVDMARFKHVPAPTLSGGETQRIALARALVLAPAVFLCDEPTASVDMENQAAIVALLKEINAAKNISIIFTSHDRLLAAGLAHQLLLLNHGSLVATGYDNFFPCTLKKHDGRHLSCCLPGGVRLIMPDTTEATPGPGKISIDPGQIQLAPRTEAMAGTNRLMGRVVQLMADGANIRIVVDVGVLLTILLEPDDYAALHPKIGDDVAVAIDRHALSFCP